MLKSNLNETSRGRNKSEKYKSASENIKLIKELGEVVTKLFDDYSSIISENKYKTIHEKVILGMLACVAKIFHHSNLKT